MLSVITWTNRLAFSGANDNRFDDVFGPNANAAIAVVDAAISSWARRITSFNYSAPITSYDMTISMATSGTSNGAGAKPTAYTILEHFAGWCSQSISDFPSGPCRCHRYVILKSALGKPFQGTMTIGRGGDGPDVDVDIDGDNKPDKVGDGLGYFLDPTPFDSSEFQLKTNNAFAAYAAPGSPAYGQNDLYEIVLHELGHAMGFLPNSSTKALSTNTNQPDVLDSAQPTPPIVPAIGNYWRFDGGETTPLLTSYDSGGGTNPPFDGNGPQHFAPAGAQFTLNGVTYRGADDLMTPYYLASQRRLISMNDIRVLLHSYSISTQRADYYGTQYDTLDSDGTLRILTPGSGNDQVSVSSAGGIITVNMVLGSPVLGADPTTIISVFDSSAVRSIVIDTGGGSDTITVGPIGAAAISIYGGAGAADTDTLIINGATGNTELTATSFLSGAHKARGAAH